MNEKYEVLRKAGRCVNGSEADGGKVYHAVVGNSALCGTKPGRTSAGWGLYEGKAVTCPKCLKKLQKSRVSNYERIKAMSANELAEFLSETLCSKFEWCVEPDYILDWLKSEVKL